MRMNRIFAAAAAALFALAAFGFRAEAKRVLDEKLDIATLEKMAASGQIIHLEYRGDILMSRMVCTLINASPDKVWGVITDFKNYPKFIPGMLPPKITKISAKEYKVDFALDISILGPVKTTQKYGFNYVLEKPYLYMFDPEKPKGAKVNASYWKIVPAQGKKKTLVFYLDTPPDLAKLGNLAATIASEKPELALAMQVSPVSIMVQEMKKYLEGKK